MYWSESVANSERQLVAKVKQQLDITKIIGAEVALQGVGHMFLGICPFHPSQTASFAVSPRRGTYKCFGCGSTGDVISFVMNSTNCDFETALRQLAESAGLRYDPPEPPKS